MCRDDAPKGRSSTVTRFQVLVLCSCGFGCHGGVGAFPVPPGWGSWCEPSELGSLSCTGQGFRGGCRGTLTAHMPWLRPQRLQLEVLPLALQGRRPGQVWGVPKPSAVSQQWLSCDGSPAGHSSAEPPKIWAVGAELQLSGHFPPKALFLQGACPDAGASPALKWTCQPRAELDGGVHQITISCLILILGLVM